MFDIIMLMVVLVFTIAMFILNYFRYDVVAILSLMILVVLNIVPAQQAFSGFGNPAVITVAAVMVITYTISQTGFVEASLKLIAPTFHNAIFHIGILCLIGAFLSAFMNNVGALALLMPVAIQSARAAKLSISSVLMPISFATVLGGMTTKIGTPPNLLISFYRENTSGASFTLFDFAPVGLIVAISCLVYIIILGWRFIPARAPATAKPDDLYQIQDYISEVKIVAETPCDNITKSKLENLIEGDFNILGLIRGRKKRLVIPDDEILQAGDILIIEATHDDLTALINKGKLELVHGDIIVPEKLRADDINTIEVVVTAGSRVEGRSWQKMRVRSTLQLNLLAIARAGKTARNRLNHVNLNPGDVLLVQGKADTLMENVINLGLVPLAERNIQVGFARSAFLPLSLFLLGILFAATGLFRVDICFVMVVILMVLFNMIPIRRVYQSIDWSIIVLLAALIPVGNALKTTGAAMMIGSFITWSAGSGSHLLIIALLLIITMTLSDIMNNAATAVVMSPIAVSVAEIAHMSIDPLLMAVAIGASCSFLTPISHQNNTLIMVPGRYKFFDYLYLGIPVELIVLVTAVPALYYFWT